jgi:uncharacterized membrane protein
MKNSKIYFRFVFFLIVLLWCIGFSLKALTDGSGFSIVSSPVLNFFYNHVCHQDEAKLISFNGFDFLVCARCSGIYIGALLSSFFILTFFKRIKFPLTIFSITSIVLLTDVILNNFIFNFYNKISAFSTGLLFGAACFFIVTNIIEDQIILKSKD